MASTTSMSRCALGASSMVLLRATSAHHFLIAIHCFRLVSRKALSKKSICGRRVTSHGSRNGGLLIAMTPASFMGTPQFRTSAMHLRKQSTTGSVSTNRTRRGGILLRADISQEDRQHCTSLSVGTVSKSCWAGICADLPTVR